VEKVDDALAGLLSDVLEDPGRENPAYPSAVD
jgi:hypothetical protein